MRFQVGIKSVVFTVILDILVGVHGNTREGGHVDQNISNVGVESIVEVAAS